MTSSKALRLRSFAILAMAAVIGGAHATITYNFSFVITGATPNGPSPWATLLINDAGADTVNMTLTHSANSASGQFIRTLWLNMDPYPGSPAIVENSPKIQGATFIQDGINGGAGTVFDMQVDFESSNANGGANRVNPGDSVSWQVTGTGLNENAFSALSGGNLNLPAMMHIQGISTGVGSGHVAPVPEPASLAALAIGAAALLRRRTRKA